MQAAPVFASAVTADDAPVPLVTVGDGGLLVAHPQGLRVLRGVKGRMSVIAVAGKYRTGKSYLLNRLINRTGLDKSGTDQRTASTANDTGGGGGGFAIGSTVNACTKGIWIWGRPRKLADGTTIVYLDTEGLGNTAQSAEHDSRIFALSLLLWMSSSVERCVIEASAIRCWKDDIARRAAAQSGAQRDALLRCAASVFDARAQSR